MTVANTTTSDPVRPLQPADLDRVIEIDSKYALRSRRGFFEKRLTAAIKDPDDFVYLGYQDDAGLEGFLLARLYEGEFGATQKTAALDAIGVDSTRSGQGVGRQLMASVETELRDLGVSELRSRVDWRNTSLISFLANCGFRLASCHILERSPDGPLETDIEEEEPESQELDFSGGKGDYYAHLSRDRVPCRTLEESDLKDLIRIDEAVHGTRREAYYTRKMEEVLDESGLRVSMVAEIDEQVVGFIMARVDFGEFGRTEPAAVLDTIGVLPDFGRQHVGTALLSQLLANLKTLRVDSVRTEVDWNRFGLLGFLDANGFAPSQELSFVRPIF